MKIYLTILLSTLSICIYSQSIDYIEKLLSYKENKVKTVTIEDKTFEFIYKPDLIIHKLIVDGEVNTTTKLYFNSDGGIDSTRLQATQGRYERRGVYEYNDKGQVFRYKSFTKRSDQLYEEIYEYTEDGRLDEKRIYCNYVGSLRHNALQFILSTYYDYDKNRILKVATSDRLASGLSNRIDEIKYKYHKNGLIKWEKHSLYRLVDDDRIFKSREKKKYKYTFYE